MGACLATTRKRRAYALAAIAEFESRHHCTVTRRSLVYETRECTICFDVSHAHYACEQCNQLVCDACAPKLNTCPFCRNYTGL